MSNAGFVAKIFERSGTGKRGPWTAYSMKIESAETGEELPKFYQLGFEAPAFKEGDYITFESEPKDANADTVVKGTIRRPKNPPARKAKESSGNQSGGRASKATESDLFGSIGGYNTEDDIKRITYSNARDHAIKAVAVLFSHDALPSSTAQSKAGQAARFDAAMAMIDKLTVQFFYDSASGRVLEAVEDAGAVAEVKVDELPDQTDGNNPDNAEAEYDNSDLPPVEEDDDVIG